MRRLLSLILLAGLASILAAPFAGAAGTARAMACCRGGSKMVCCAPSAGCEMSSCPGGDRETVLPALPPAILESPSSGIEMAPLFERIPSSRDAAVPFAVDPPERPPRG
jgi:hypothetical protein